jgi:hypothetical protein
MGTIALLVAMLAAAAALGDETSPAQQAAVEQIDQSQSVCARVEGEGCFWMENETGNFCWVKADWAATREECFNLDSCDGGKGLSGGGCYKWAECSDCERQAWTDETQQSQQQAD